MCCKYNNLSEHPLNTERLTALMDSLTNNTVLGELLEPVSDALARVRGSAAFARVLNMENFITLGVLRHLQAMHTLREQVQSLFASGAGSGTAGAAGPFHLVGCARFGTSRCDLGGGAAAAVGRSPGGAAGSAGGVRRARRTPWCMQRTAPTSRRAPTMGDVHPARVVWTTPRVTHC